MEIGARVFSGGGDQSQSDSESDTDSVKMSRDKEPEKGSRSRSTDRVSRERSNSVDLEEDSIIEESVIQRVESLIGGSAERERLRRKKVCYIVIGVVDMILGGTHSQNQKKMWEMITITGVSNSWIEAQWREIAGKGVQSQWRVGGQMVWV